MHPRTRRCACILLLTLANAGCGVGFFYNNLDRVIRWELDGVLAMTADQEAFFEAEFAALWGWHRTHELPRYADDLGRWGERFGGSATPADIDELFATLEGWWLRLEAKGTPFVAEFLRRLDDEQVQFIDARPLKSPMPTGRSRRRANPSARFAKPGARTSRAFSSASLAR